MKKILNFMGLVIVMVMAIDFLGFVAWVMSGQFPLDSVYIGAITTNLLKLIM